MEIKKVSENKPKVSILVVNYNQDLLLQKCLDSIQKQSYPNIETIVLDNASTDTSVKTVKNNYPEVNLIESEKNLYFAEGNNLAYEKSKGEFIFLLNNDAYIENDTVEKLVDYLDKNEDVGIIQNKLVHAQNPKKVDSAGSMFSIFGFLIHRSHNQESKDIEPTEIFSGKGASLFMRRELIEEIGLFDPDYKMYFEDTDLCWRTWLAGKKVVYFPNTTTYHYVSQSMDNKNIGTLDYYSFRNRVQTLIKNLSLLSLLIVLPVHIQACLLLSFIYLFSNLTISKAIIRALFWNIVNLKYTLRKRNTIQSIRTTPDLSFLPKLSIFPNPLYIFNFLKFYAHRTKQK